MWCIAAVTLFPSQPGKPADGLLWVGSLNPHDLKPNPRPNIRTSPPVPSCLHPSYCLPAPIPG